MGSYLDEPDIVTRILIRKRQEDHSVRRKCAQRCRAMRPSAKECMQLQGKEQILQEEALPTPDFSLLDSFGTSDLRNYERINLCCFKSINL